MAAARLVSDLDPKPPAAKRANTKSVPRAHAQASVSFHAATHPTKSAWGRNEAAGPAQPSAPPAAPPKHTTSCKICDTATLFRDDSELLQHFVDLHSLDGYSLVTDEYLFLHDLAPCHDCGKVFKAGLVHAKDKCKLSLYRSSAKYISSRKSALINSISPRDILMLNSQNYAALEDLFNKPAGRCNDLRFNKVLQEDFRMLFILSVRACQLAAKENFEDSQIRAWTWLLQLPALALPLRSSFAGIADRLASLMKGQAASLLLPDVNMASNKNKPHQSSTVDDDASRAWQATKLLRASGNIGKTADRMFTPSTPVAYCPDNADLVDELLLTDDVKQPSSSLPTKSHSIPDITQDMVSSAIKASSNSAPAITGWAANLIKMVAATPQGLQAVTYVVNAIFHHTMPDCIIEFIRTQRLLLLSKSPKEGVRPILISDAWVRLLETCIAIELPQLAFDMQPLQMAVGAKSGAEDIIHMARAALHANPDAIMVKTDFKNAFGSIYKSAIFDAVHRRCPVDNSDFLRWYLNRHLRQPSTYLASDGSKHHYNRGVAQGSPLSMFLFCTTVQDALEEVHAHASTASARNNCITMAYADDTTFIGCPEAAINAACTYARLVAPLGIILQPMKSVIMATTPDSAAYALHSAEGLGFPDPVSHTSLLGAPVGSLVSEEIDDLHHLVNEELFARLPLMGDPQSQLLVLRQCIITKYTFMARSCPPDATHQPLAKLELLVDNAIRLMLECKQDLPALSSHIIRLPLSMGGLGLTSLHQVRAATYYASAAHSLNTWSRFLGHDHPVIQSWVDSHTRSCTQLSAAHKAMQSLIHDYNADNKRISRSTASKAKQEQFIDTPPPPAIVNSIKQLRHGPSTPLKSAKLQHELAHLVDVRTFRAAWNIAADVDPALCCQFLSNSVPGATVWARVTPENNQFKFSESEFRIIMAQHLCMDNELARLLRLPQGTAHPIPCACASDGFVSEVQARNEDSDVDTRKRNAKATTAHLFNCQQEYAFTQRHTALMQVVMNAAESAGLQPSREQPPLRRSVATNTNGQRLSPPRFDVTIANITPEAKTIQCDVSVCSSRRYEYREYAARAPLYAADKKYKEKLNRYRDCIFPDREIIMPLVAESSGAIHPNVARLFSMLGARCANQPPPEASASTPSFSSFFTAVFSCTLRRETARSLLRIANAARQRANLTDDDTFDDVDILSHNGGLHDPAQAESASADGLSGRL